MNGDISKAIPISVISLSIVLVGGMFAYVNAADNRIERNVNINTTVNHQQQLEIRALEIKFNAFIDEQRRHNDRTRSDLIELKNGLQILIQRNFDPPGAGPEED